MTSRSLTSPINVFSNRWRSANNPGAWSSVPRSARELRSRQGKHGDGRYVGNAQGLCAKSLGTDRRLRFNRYCYQSAIPRKDASFIARTDDPELRRMWRQRLVDHDGDAAAEGGIARWLALTGGLGLDYDYVVSRRGAL